VVGGEESGCSYWKKINKKTYPDLLSRVCINVFN
jgi:hypothetical protein